MGSGSVVWTVFWLGLFGRSRQFQTREVGKDLFLAATAFTAGLILLLHRFPSWHSQALLSAVGLGLAPLSVYRKQCGLKLEPAGGQRSPRFDSAVIQHLTRFILAGFELINAKSAAVVLFDAKTGGEIEWRVPSASPETGKLADLLELCTAGIESEWGLAQCYKRASAIHCLVLDREGNKLRKLSFKNGFLASWNGAFETALLSNFEFDSRWRGRIVFYDPAFPRGDKGALRRLQRIVRLTTESYKAQPKRLLGRARDERHEIARDLHDGVTQSLIAAEMHVDALRRQGLIAGIPTVAEEVLAQTQELLRREVKKLRLQIEELRSNSNSLLICQQVSNFIQNFEAETGIRTTFICDGEHTEISPRTAHDLAHIVQEALSNIRKHSGAGRVDVRLSMDRQIHLVIQDDGRGFDFSGKYSLADLEISGKGPRVIRERVWLSGGGMLIESRPSRGARLELTLPLRDWSLGSDRFNKGSLRPKIRVRQDQVGKHVNVA